MNINKNFLLLGSIVLIIASCSSQKKLVSSGEETIDTLQAVKPVPFKGEPVSIEIGDPISFFNKNKILFNFNIIKNNFVLKNGDVIKKDSIIFFEREINPLTKGYLQSFVRDVYGNFSRIDVSFVFDKDEKIITSWFKTNLDNFILSGDAIFCYKNQEFKIKLYLEKGIVNNYLFFRFLNKKTTQKDIKQAGNVDLTGEKEIKK